MKTIRKYRSKRGHPQPTAMQLRLLSTFFGYSAHAKVATDYRFVSPFTKFLEFRQFSECGNVR
jgi:hypothetical protein